MLLFLIGPSGAGKSTIAKCVVQKNPYIKYVDLDEVIRDQDRQLFYHNGDRWDKFWKLAIECLENIRKYSSGISLIDCGAGCLQTSSALSFFKSERFVILLIGTPKVLFNRAKNLKPYWQNKTLHEYQAGEFSE